MSNASLDSSRRLASGEVVTPRGRLLYPSLFKKQLMKGETDESRAKYGVSILLRDSGLTAMMEAVNEKIVDKWGADARKKFKIRMPFIKTEEQPRFSELASDFPVLIRTSTKDKPGVVYANMKECDESSENEVYSGRWGRLTVNAFAYEHPTGGKGVSFGLQHVQLLEHDDVLAGGRIRVENAFEAVELESAASGATLSEDLWG